ncbi:hypothetical protein BaRGS_00026178 [Batillaria attramentaria]|uniref:Uncharacterized protein n=1 Tax=Batillaria attramentaria TaxID=370345 RepID=A0ABD0K671_9CAEN
MHKHKHKTPQYLEQGSDRQSFIVHVTSQYAATLLFWTQGSPSAGGVKCSIYITKMPAPLALECVKGVFCWVCHDNGRQGPGWGGTVCLCTLGGQGKESLPLALQKRLSVHEKTRTKSEKS